MFLGSTCLGSELPVPDAARTLTLPLSGILDSLKTQFDHDRAWWGCICSDEKKAQEVVPKAVGGLFFFEQKNSKQLHTHNGALICCTKRSRKQESAWEIEDGDDSRLNELLSPTNIY